MELVDFPGPGTLVRHRVAPRSLPARSVDVWLPPGLGVEDAVGARSVVYAHDGQNLFLPAISYAGVPWSLHTAALAAAAGLGVRAPVLVGVWNAGDARRREYLPPAPRFEPAGQAAQRAAVVHAAGGPAGERYVRMLLEDVVPMVEARHGIHVGASRRAVLGSSMGGLISLYAALTRPETFGAAACVSTHLVAGGRPLVDWFAALLPEPGGVRLWLDRGTVGLDAQYEPFQDRLDAALVASPLVAGRDWVSRIYPGADHSEHSWAARAADVMTFLLAGRAAGRSGGVVGSPAWLFGSASTSAARSPTS